MDALWPKLAPIAIAPRPISPRFIEHINNLGNFNTNRPAFKKAVSTLRAQQDFEGLLVLLGEPRPHFLDNKDSHPTLPTLPILQVLLSDGLISPAAATWLALCVHQDAAFYNTYIPLFYGFSAIRQKVWNDHNVHLAACVESASKKESITASRISAVAARDTYTSALPGTIKHALGKQKELVEKKSTLRKADRTLAGSRGSRKSKCIQGLSPKVDILKEEDRAMDDVRDETTSEALRTILDTN